MTSYTRKARLQLLLLLLVVSCCTTRRVDAALVPFEARRRAVLPRSGHDSRRTWFQISGRTRHSRHPRLFASSYEEQYAQFTRGNNNNLKKEVENDLPGRGGSYDTAADANDHDNFLDGSTTPSRYTNDSYDYRYQQNPEASSQRSSWEDPASNTPANVQPHYENQSYTKPATPVESSVYEDPYEMQYRQYFQSPSGTETPAMASIPAVTEVTESSPANTEAAVSPPVNTEVPRVLSSRPTTAEKPRDTPSPPDTSTKVTTENDDEEERFLRMVSNEVQYKRLIGQNPYAIGDIKWPVLRQRLLDNLEDSTQKTNGKLKGQSKLRGKDAPREERKTVVVLGTGWASHAFVKLASTYDLRIVVVSPVNHFVFTPMLASAAVGTVEYRSMTESIRITNPYIDNFVEGRAIGIDVSQKKLQVQLTALGTVTGQFKGIASESPCRLEGEPVLTNIAYSEDGSQIERDMVRQGASDVIELNYDTLICAVGTASRSAMVTGAKEHCFNLKTSQDSKRLRTAIGEALEYASRPDVQEFYYDGEEEKVMAKEERRRRVRIAVVGGGPTGVELCGELKDFFSQVCGFPDGAYQHLKDDISVMLVHGGSDLLPAMDKDLRDRALESLESQGVQIRLNTRLKEVGRDYITIFEKGNTAAEETIPVGITVWAAGNAPVPFVKELLSQLPTTAAGSAGRVNVDSWLRCPTPTEDTFGSILVLGDVACFQAEKEKFDDEPQILPQTAQVAGQQGAFAARLLNRGYDLQRTPPKLPESAESSLLRTWLIARGLEEATGYNFLSLGLLAYIGQEEALNQVAIGNVPLFNYSGKIAFALWRSVYLTKQASTRNQALIAFDWLRTTTFGRDITRL